LEGGSKERRENSSGGDGPALTDKGSAVSGIKRGLTGANGGQAKGVE